MVDAYVKPNAPFALSVAKGLMSEESDPSLRSGRTGQRLWQTVKGRGKPSKGVREATNSMIYNRPRNQTAPAPRFGLTQSPRATPCVLIRAGVPTL